MPTFAQSPCRSVRDSVFSIGDSPEVAGLRIQSFIDYRWGMNMENEAWNPQPSFLFPTVEEHPRSSTDDEEDFWRSEGHGALHRYTPSTSSVGTSVLFSQDTEIDDLEYELPSLGTARLQSHKSMPTGRLVYVAKSPITASKRNARRVGAVQSSVPQLSRRSDWSRTLSALFEYTWNEHHHEQIASAPLRRQTVHACQTSISEIPSFANECPVLSVPEMPSKPGRYEVPEMLGAHGLACNDSQAKSHWPQSHNVEYFAQALRSHPTVPTRASSLPGPKVLAKGGLVEDDETVMGSDDESAIGDGLKYGGSSSPSPVLSKLSQLPSTPKKSSVPYDIATQKAQHGGHSPSRAGSLSLFPHSPAQTLLGDATSTYDLKACDSFKSGTEADNVILKSRLRRWWERYCRRNKC